MIAFKYSTTALAVTISLLTGCGGGGGSSNNPPVATTPSTPTTPVATAPKWEPGIYEPQSRFIARCENPRRGTDPFTGDTYPDTQGSALEEKLWLRSWTNETYLWYNEVPDRDPANYTILDYFELLRTNEVTASGNRKDEFHWSIDTAEYNALAQSGISSGYGFNWKQGSVTVPRWRTVNFTEPNSPAATANIPRGAVLKRVNGIDYINDNTQRGVDILNAALFPDKPGIVTNFEFRLPDDSSISVEITSGDIVLSPVQNVKVLDSQNGRVGYFQFNTFNTTAQQNLIDAFDSFVEQNVTELVIDLRYNGGGRLALASQLSYMVAGPSQTNNAIFETLRFNDKSPSVNPVTGEPIRPTPFYDKVIDYSESEFTDVQLPSLSLTRVYVLTTDATCSASEAVMNALRGIDVEVVQIGSRTCGKPFGFYPTDNCGETYFTIQFQGVNNKGFGDYADGFRPASTPNFDFELPGCRVEDDLSKSLGDPNEGMLSAALHYAATGSCPEIASSNGSALIEGASGFENASSDKELIPIDSPEQRRKTFILHNKINQPVIEKRK